MKIDPSTPPELIKWAEELCDINLDWKINQIFPIENGTAFTLEFVNQFTGELISRTLERGPDGL